MDKVMSLFINDAYAMRFCDTCTRSSSASYVSRMWRDTARTTLKDTAVRVRYVTDNKEEAAPDRVLEGFLPKEWQIWDFDKQWAL
jgi:hypothetical protein